MGHNTPTTAAEKISYGRKYYILLAAYSKGGMVMPNKKRILFDGLPVDTFGEIVLYNKWDEFLDEGPTQTDKIMLERFRKVNNLPAESGLAMVFSGFVAGMNKGMEISGEILKAQTKGELTEFIKKEAAKRK